MSNVSVHVLYTDLNKLLEDICDFLREEIDNGNISSKMQRKANILIDRSKTQLQAIAKLNPSLTLTDNESYVDMQGNKVDINVEDERAIYDEIKDEIKPEVLTIKTEHTSVDEPCPFSDSPAKFLTTDKHGTISLKTKIIFGLEKNKQIYACVCKNWFLMYHTEKDQKPYQTISLKLFEHKIIDEDQNKHCFLLCNDKKSFHFTAITKKDMLQWVSAIKRNSSIESESVEDEDDEEDDEIYQPIMNEPKPCTAITSVVLPSLPPRMYLENNHLHEKESLSDSDTDETYDKVDFQAKNNPDTSHSEDEEIYNYVCPPPKKIPPIIKPKPSLTAKSSNEEPLQSSFKRQDSFLSRHSGTKFSTFLNKSK